MGSNGTSGDGPLEAKASTSDGACRLVKSLGIVGRWTCRASDHASANPAKRSRPVRVSGGGMRRTDV